MNISVHKYIIRTLCVICTAAILLCMYGCVDTVSKFYHPTTEPAATAPEDDGSEDILIDFDGNSLKLDKAPQRIVSLTPVATEIICGLGRGNNLIAIDEYSEKTEDKPATAEVFKAYEITADKLAAYNPDMVFYSDGYNVMPSVFEQLKLTDMTLVRIPDKGSVKTAEANIRFLSSVLFCKNVGDKMINDIRARLKVIKNSAEYLQIQGTVYIEYYPLPNTYACGADTVISELCAIAGLTNIYADINGYSAVSIAETIKRNPDYIISVCQYVNYSASEINERDGWGELNAVKTGKVKQIVPEYAIRPTQNIVKALEEIAVITGIINEE